jgi:hypothetical protein
VPIYTGFLLVIKYHSCSAEKGTSGTTTIVSTEKESINPLTCLGFADKQIAETGH